MGGVAHKYILTFKGITQRSRQKEERVKVKRAERRTK
jgi:hypothetical protein